MAQGHGFGKTILFGEHFVVYGLPGIVAVLDKKIEVSVEPSKTSEYSFVDVTKKFPDVPPLTWEVCQSAAWCCGEAQNNPWWRLANPA